MHESRFFCSFEWHAARDLSKTAVLVYTHALRLSKKHKYLFFYSAQQLADYLNVRRETVQLAFGELEESGFFIREREELFCTTQYRVVPHAEWAALHPGRCAEKLKLDTVQENDPLAAELYLKSTGRFKPRTHHLNILRSFGFSDARLLDLFAAFLDSDTQGRGKLFQSFCFYIKRHDAQARKAAA